MDATIDQKTTQPMAAWSAVFALTLCASTLVATEWMPVSLLTPIARGLELTEGQAGQAISVSGFLAILTSLFISTATRGVDRRTVLLWLTGVMLISGVVVAFAPTFAVFMAGRALVGMVVGGFWSMSAATMIRIVPAKDLPRALAVLNGGNALATTIAAPLGSFLGQYIGWRGAFFCVVPIAALTLLWQFITLPRMPSQERASAAAAFKVLRRPGVPYGMLAAALFFLGQFALFTYLRPFLETVTRVDVTTISALLLVMGVAGLIGTSLIGLVIRERLHTSLMLIPLAMALIAIALTAFGTSLGATVTLMFLWGFIGTAAPVGWWTWLSEALPDDAEAGGGLMVAVIQLAITAGAAGGGVLFDSSGYQATFLFSALILMLSSFVMLAGTLRRRAAARCATASPVM
ncbi:MULTISPECIES: MFS transporter [Bradyrhizobium]|jgi:predicted MFS family arabinose efflux permease|uniref:MFS transporter n=1 Tax=Bradyrhizobium TaxID=374 RepID=UPI0003FC6F27|nr:MULTISPECIES: MFS transporter [Bradyrhizobium]KIU51290.1 transcriptional regulator [Bradyrhizobium elkanii]OCX28167.1 transcriptional regulator [Bradyrhizobium sp. UASWS1016]